MDKGKQIRIILENILENDKLNIYTGNNVMSYYDYHYVNHCGFYVKPDKVKYCGVYWLYDRDEVVYIGYSGNIISRIRSHILSSKVWDKVKLILFDDLNIAKSVERTLLLNIQTKYNNPNFNRGYTAKSRYMNFKRDINMGLKLYGMYSHLSDGEILENVGVGVLNYINNIDLYRTYANISFQEYEKNFNLKLKGLKHNLLIT
jgi:hypothetical protein